MAGIVLKDGGGNVIEYSDINQIRVPYRNDDGEMSVYKFHRLVSLRSYILRQNGSSNGIAMYEVISSLQLLASDDFFACSPTDAQIQELSTAMIFITTKRLTVGNTYLANEIF